MELLVLLLTPDEFDDFLPDEAAAPDRLALFPVLEETADPDGLFDLSDRFTPELSDLPELFVLLPTEVERP